ncbi:hypothetical protein GCM10027063_35580 [Promicromonospora xylanilytica]
MLASTMQFSSNGRTHPATRDTTTSKPAGYDTNQMTRTRTRNTHPAPPKRGGRPVASGPNSVLSKPPTPDQPRSNP